MQPGMAPVPGEDVGEPPALLGEVQRALENFEKVPVVNFGWVALFILVYILIVGPLDYFLLKRVFKRLELTWITFPVIVLVVSAAAYGTAYYLKGDDLRVNKIDLVEYDLNSPQEAYGTTWFTLFSPRIQNYTVGLEPSAPGWAAAPPADATSHPVTVSALANPDLSERVGSSSLFRQPYAYAEDASGLERVPIPVWSTRSFQASWRRPRPRQAAARRHSPPCPGRRQGPSQVGRRHHQPAAGRVAGRHAVLPRAVVHSSQRHRGGRDVRRADAVRARQNRQVDGLWVNDPQTLAPPAVGPNGVPTAAQNDNDFNGFRTPQSFIRPKRPYELMKDLMFHGKAEGSQMLNSGLRTLDESWRLNAEKTASGESVFRDEVILVGRTPTLSDRAETVANNPGSATRIWLDRLPDGKSAPPALPGYLAQETYVRVYIPLQPSKPDGADKP